MRMDKSEVVREAAENLEKELTAAGIDVLFDDRDARPGVMFADIELLGIPHRVVIGEKSLADGKVEYRARQESENRFIKQDWIVEFLKEELQQVIG